MRSDFSLVGLPDPIARDLAQVEEKIASRSGSETVDRINQVVTHLFSGGGKRIRPVLTLSTANLLGCSGEEHVNLATAVEFVHTATLVHDDVVDESMQRRGRPTANTIWDNKTSVLVGDYLFARSFQLMVAAQSIEALLILADASATISEAEILQLVSQQDLAMGDATYFRIIRGKTAALFSAAAKVGAVVARADAAAIAACEEYGDALGVSFQIMDDLLDYSGETLRLGKNVGDDFRERKVTLPILRAMETADAEEQSFWHRTLSRGEQSDGDIERARVVLRERGILDQTRKEAESWASRAKGCLNRLPAGEITDFLAGLAEFTVSRTS